MRLAEFVQSLDQEVVMLLLLAILLAVAWVLGFTVFHVASAGLHALIIIAVIVAIAHFITRRGATV